MVNFSKRIIIAHYGCISGMLPRVANVVLLFTRRFHVSKMEIGLKWECFRFCMTQNNEHTKQVVGACPYNRGGGSYEAIQTYTVLYQDM